MQRTHALPLAVSVAASAMLIFVGLGAKAETTFDGSWNAVLVTEAGKCDKSGQVSAKIVNGTLVNPGGGVALSGRVAPGGEVSGKAAMGPYYVTGSGRLLSNSGSGTWRGQGPNGPCSGVWTANRV